MEHPDDLTLDVSIRASRATVWQSLTERREQWWPDMHFVAEPGAPLREEWTDGGRLHSASGVVTESRPGDALAFEWRQAGWEGPLQVTFSLAPAPDGTLLRLRETGFAALGSGTRLRDDHLGGWRFHLANLVRHAESAGSEQASTG